MRVDGWTVILPSPSVAPHDSGKIIVPGTVDLRTPVTIRFTDRRKRSVDEEVIRPQSPPPVHSTPGRALSVDSTATELSVHGEGFEVRFDRTTGLIVSARHNGEKIIEAGPYIRVIKRGPALTWDVDTTYDIGGMMWRPDAVHMSVTPGQVRMRSHGRTDSLTAQLDIAVTSGGEIITSYEILDPPTQCQEAGIRFLLGPALDRIEWDRKALWSSYPAGHIGRPQGEAAKFVRHVESEAAHRDPDRTWEQDTRDSYLFPSRRGSQPTSLPVPNDFRARRENIFRYALLNGGTGNGIEVLSPGTVAARAAVRPDGMLDLLIANEWTYLNLNWGNYERPALLARPYRNTITVHLLGK